MMNIGNVERYINVIILLRFEHLHNVLHNPTPRLAADRFYRGARDGVRNNRGIVT